MSLQKNVPERLVRQFQKHNKVLFQYQVPLRPEVLLKNSIKWPVSNVLRCFTVCLVMD